MVTPGTLQSNVPQNGLAVVLRTVLGVRWDSLHPDIRRRFTMAPGATGAWKSR